MSVSIRYIAVLGFQLSVPDTRQAFSAERFPSAISRYLVSNMCSAAVVGILIEFPSAISRYLVSNASGRPSQLSIASFHPLYRGTWFPTVRGNTTVMANSEFPSAISRYLVSNITAMLGRAWGCLLFPSAISRYLVSNPTRKTPPLTSGGGNGLHTPRRIDHIPTFASLNHDKNTRSTHYTPNAGIEFSQAGFVPPHVNPVQKWA